MRRDEATPDLFAPPPRHQAPPPHAKRDAGIGQAVDHADKVREQWSQDAYSLLLRYAPSLGDFAAPDLRVIADALHFPEPPSLRAWGGVFQRAARAGALVPVGFKQASDDMHGQPIRVWRWAAK